MLTKFYEITQSYFNLTALNGINSITASMNQYVIYLFLYNVLTIFDDNYSYYNDNGLTQEPSEYIFFKNKYSINNDAQLSAALSYSMFAIGRLVFANTPQVKNKPIEEVKILFGFTPEVEEVYNYYFGPEFTLFINIFAKTSYDNRILIQNIYDCNSCFTNPNQVSRGGPGPFPVDVNGTPQEYLNNIKEPNNYINIRVPTGVVKNENGLPIIDPSIPASYSDKTYNGWQVGWLNGFWYNDVTRYNIPSVEYSKLNTWNEIKVEANKMLIEYADLNDDKKIISEFFNNNLPGGIGTSQILLLWSFIFNLKNNIDLRKEVSFVFANAAIILDTLASTWEIKREFNSGRPVTTIRNYLSNTNINTWYPFQGTVSTTGNKFLPYQMLNFVTPPHGENLAGHPASYTAVANLFAKLYGVEFYDPNFEFEFDKPQWIYPSLAGQTKFVFGQFITPDKSSIIEPGLTPENPIVLTWPTIFDWAIQCGVSRLYGGIHWESSIKASEKQAEFVAEKVVEKLNKFNILNI